tara:strand:- start:125 stop:985 length:861 start_codon:yes stop_codon:yes gene_type:complete
MNERRKKNQYTLPDGNVLISFSGGRTSAFMLYKILEAQDWKLPKSCKVVFANTGREMPQTYDFVQKCSNEWGIPITWLEYKVVKDNKNSRNRYTFKVVDHNSASRNGEPFESLVKVRQTLPNNFQRFCTVEMKILTIKRYLKDFGWKEWFNTVGIRADEQHRIKESRDIQITNWYPIALSNHGKHDIMAFWEKQPFDLKITPGFGNCDGCFLKSEKNIAALWRLHPERAKWWMNLEENNHSRRKKYRTFHKTRTYKEIGEFVSRQGDWIFDTEGVFCQADDGECTG